MHILHNKQPLEQRAQDIKNSLERQQTQRELGELTRIKTNGLKASELENFFKEYNEEIRAAPIKQKMLYGNDSANANKPPEIDYTVIIASALRTINYRRATANNPATGDKVREEALNLDERTSGPTEIKATTVRGVAEKEAYGLDENKRVDLVYIKINEIGYSAKRKIDRTNQKKTIDHTNVKINKVGSSAERKIELSKQQQSMDYTHRKINQYKILDAAFKKVRIDKVA